jgi:hypothetical protein
VQGLFLTQATQNSRFRYTGAIRGVVAKQPETTRPTKVLPPKSSWQRRPRCSLFFEGWMNREFRTKGRLRHLFKYFMDTDSEAAIK